MVARAGGRRLGGVGRLVAGGGGSAGGGAAVACGGARRRVFSALSHGSERAALRVGADALPSPPPAPRVAVATRCGG